MADVTIKCDMSIQATNMVNESFDPGERERAVLRHLKDGRDRGEPWGYTSASVAGEALDMPRQYTSNALGSLHDAGWVEKVEPTGTGIYRFVSDPRENTDA
jgi:hypothetical protein